MAKIKKAHKPKPHKSCYICNNLRCRRYMTSPYSGGIDYNCKKTGKKITDPEDVVCDDFIRDTGKAGE